MKAGYYLSAFLLFFSLAATPGAEKKTEQCLPGTLDGQTFLFTVESSVAPDNPNAGFFLFNEVWAKHI